MTFPTLDMNFGGYIKCTPNTDTLRDSIDPTRFSQGDAIIVSGNSYTADGAGGIYQWLPNSTDADDNYLIIAPAGLNGGPGRWKLSVGPTPEFQALAQQVAALTASVGNSVASLTTANATTSASITTEQTVRANADAALATRTTTLEAHYSTQQTSLDGLTTALATTNASLTDEETARADADEALASRTTTLEADYTSQQNAVNGVINGLTTTKANLVSEQTVRANADGALAQQITNLSASTTAFNTEISARVSDEVTARTTADSALATRTSTLEASTGTLTARVTETESAVSALNGKTEAYWQVETVAGNNRAQLTVHADANGGAGVDIVGDVSISGNLVVDGTVTTGKLANNGVSNGDVVASTTSFAPQGGVTVSVSGYSVGSWQSIVSYALHLDNAARLDVDTTVKQSFSDTDGDPSAAWAGRINVSGSIIDDGWGQRPLDKFQMMGSIQLAPGDYTVSFDWQANSDVTAYRPKMRLAWRYK